MGFLHNGVCYPTSEAAKKAVCSDAGQMVLEGVNMQASGCISTDFSLATFDVVTVTNGAYNAVHTFYYPEFLDCDHTYSAGLIGAWLAAAMLLCATLWGLRRMVDLFSGRLDG